MSLSPSPPSRSSRLIDDEKLHCPHCEYNLTGQLAAGVSRCPECGATFDRRIELVSPPTKPAGLFNWLTPDDQPHEPSATPSAWWSRPELWVWAASPMFLMLGACVFQTAWAPKATIGVWLLRLAAWGGLASLCVWAYVVRQPPRPMTAADYYGLFSLALIAWLGNILMTNILRFVLGL